ncbi:MAG: DUF4157 domain-containing protein [Ilumatobacteraceae bacterium]
MTERPSRMAERPTAIASTDPPPVRTVPQRLPLAPGELPAPSPRPVVAAAAGGRSSAERPPTVVSSARPGVRLAGRARPIQRLSGETPALTAAPPPGGSGPAPVPVRRSVQRSPETVPPDLRSELEPRLGESLDDVRVHRGPEVGDAARSIRAKAFAVGGEVFLPDEHGPTTAGEGRRILAHELTHVAQQRRFGSSLPAEHTPEGQRLEREALEVGGQAPVPARRTSVAGRGSPQRLAGSSDPIAPRGVSPVRAADSPPDLAAQRAAMGAGIPASVTTAPGPPTRQMSAAGADASSDRLGSVGSSPSTPPVQRLVEIERVESTSEPSDGTDALDLEELERQLYPRLRSRLRNDLLTDRERSGRLFDRS